MTVKEKVYSLVDALPPEKLPEAERLLEGLLGDPLLRVLSGAPIDDEPYTEEQQRHDEEARARFLHGEGVPHEELGKRLRKRAS